MTIDILRHAEQLFRTFLYDGSEYSKCAKTVFTAVSAGETADSITHSSGRKANRALTAMIDLIDVKEFSLKLYNYFINMPVDLLIIAEKAFHEILAKELGHAADILVTVTNNPAKTPVSDLGPEHIDTVVSVEAVVVRQSFIKPVMVNAAFQCSSIKPDGTTYCGYTFYIPIIGGVVQSPEVCPKCSRKGVKLDTTLSKFKDRQSIKLQDVSATTQDWSNNQGVVGIVHDPYIHHIRPGDHVIVHSLYKAVPSRVRARVTTVKSIFKTYLDIIHIEKINSRISHLKTLDQEDIAAERLAQYKEIADRKKILAIFAPGIELLDRVKLGLLCSIVGGCSIEGTARGCIHTLLVGDPATAKSQLLGAAKKVAPRSTYVCGRGTTSAGLTATVVRDAESGEFLLEPGAVVVADQGLCCIDEFDKVDESGRIVLNELMEQQSVSVAKAGIVCSLNARTSIVACANPIYSKFDTKRSITENINMPLTLLSRFDLIFLLTDPNDTSYDNKIAKSLLQHYDPVNQRTDTSDKCADGNMSENDYLLKEYLAYAREFIHPSLSVESQELLKESYCSMRSNNNYSSNVTTRRLRSLVRIAEALARLELRQEVTVGDVNEALLLVSSSTTILNRNAEDDNENMRIKNLIMNILQAAGESGLSERDVKLNISNTSGIKTQSVVDILLALERARTLRSTVTGAEKMYSINTC